MIKSILKYSLLVLLTAAIITGVVWSNMEWDKATCVAIDINIDSNNGSQFITAEGIEEDLAKSCIPIVGITMRSIPFDSIEKTLLALDYIESVECYPACSPVNTSRTIPLVDSGHLIIDVTQFTPIMRVFRNDGSSYYVNKDGKKMDADLRFRKDVVAISGNFSPQFPETSLLPLVHHINSDKHLSQLVTMIKAVDSDNIYLIPSIKGHVVNFGDIENIDGKFQKLKLFYSKVIKYKGWNFYDTISVKWNHQVVATQRNPEKKEVEEYNPDEDEIPASPEMLDNALAEDTTLN